MVIRVVGIVSASVGTAITLLFANGIYLYNKFKAYLPDLNTRSFWGIIKGIYNVVPGKQKISLLVQFGILILIAIGVLIYTLKQKAKPILSKANFIKTTNKTNSGTDLDTLYRMLLSKKEIDIGGIETAFKVSHEVAMEWCKILENANLALIDYPTFKKPILRLPEEEKIEDLGEEVKRAKEKMDKKLKDKSSHIKTAKPSVVKIEKPKKIKNKSSKKKIKVKKLKSKANKKENKPKIEKKKSKAKTKKKESIKKYSKNKKRV